MAVTGLCCYFDAPAVKTLRVFRAAQFFERLTTVDVASGVVGVVVEEGGELFHRCFQLARIDILHCEAVTAKGVRGVLLDHGFEDFCAAAGHLYCYYIVQ